MDKNTPNADRICGLENAASRIIKEISPNASPLPCLIYGKASENDYRNRIGHISFETPRDSFDRYRPRSQRIVANNRVFFAQDIRTRTAAGLIRPRTALEPIVQ